jgi:quercetin dioxygenase-like cupin family protein
VERLRQEPEWRTAHHNAITLLKQPGLNLILLVLGRGHVLDEHRAPGPISVHVLTGRVRFDIAGKDITLAAGEIVTMERGTPHELSALEESTLLLTIGGGGGKPRRARQP